MKFIQLFTLVFLLSSAIYSCSTSDKKSEAKSKESTTNEIMAANTGTYTLDGVTKSGICRSTPSQYCKEAIDVIIIPKGENKAFGFHNMPKASSGTFQINEYMSSLRGCKEYAIYTDVHSNPAQFGTKTGTITKLSANSFTFNFSLYDHESNQTKSISGSGTY